MERFTQKQVLPTIFNQCSFSLLFRYQAKPFFSRGFYFFFFSRMDLSLIWNVPSLFLLLSSFSTFPSLGWVKSSSSLLWNGSKVPLERLTVPSSGWPVKHIFLIWYQGATRSTDYSREHAMFLITWLVAWPIHFFIIMEAKPTTATPTAAYVNAFFMKPSKASCARSSEEWTSKNCTNPVLNWERERKQKLKRGKAQRKRHKTAGNDMQEEQCYCTHRGQKTQKYHNNNNNW